jgi:hypothetical protein
MKAFLAAFGIATGLTTWFIADSCGFKANTGDTCYMAKGLSVWIWPFFLLTTWPIAFVIIKVLKNRNSGKKDE